jgi:hypothetical protein
MTTEVSASEWIDSESYLGPRMKRITFQCAKCGHTWIRTLKAEPKKDPPCPSKRCEEVAERAQLKRENENLRRMLQEQQGPATIGANLRVKAIDETANIVMKDHNMTDLRSDMREGDTMAPKLPQHQQALADAMLAKPKKGGVVPVISMDGAQRRTIPADRLQAIGNRAIRGMYAGNSVKPTAVIPKERPAPVRLTNERYDKSRPTAERK